MPREEIGSDRSPNTATSKSTRGGSEDLENKIGNGPFQVQSEFVNTLQDLTRDWMARATSEVELGLKLSKKLSAAHSVPDAIAAYQGWLSRGDGRVLRRREPCRCPMGKSSWTLALDFFRTVG